MLTTRSLTFKLSAAFLLLIFVITSVSLFVTTQGLEKGILEAEQKEAIPIAQELSRQIKDHISPNLNHEAVFALFVRFSKLNSRLTPYLISKDGNIIVSSLDRAFMKSSTFDVVKINAFLKDSSKLPILISNPKDTNNQAPFSAVRITLNASDPLLVLVIEPRKSLDSQTITSTEKSIILQAVLSFIAAALLALILSRVLTRRLRNLTDSVKRFEISQSEEIPVIKSSDEVGDLSLAFSKMAKSVLDSLSKLKERDALRRELIAGVSHDLRTPLASIKGYVEKLQGSQVLSGEKTKEALNIIERNCNVLQKLINGLFELAHLDEIVEKIEFSQFSLSELVSDVVAKFSPQAASKNIALTLTPPASAYNCSGDPSLIERAFSNIIENAILYTPENGEISASVKYEANYFIVEIKDNGRGISPEDLPNIFEKFFRGDKSREKDIAGTGLGLAVTKKIIDAHKGEIKVRSEVGKGTNFQIFLPKS